MFDKSKSFAHKWQRKLYFGTDTMKKKNIYVSKQTAFIFKHIKIHVN